MSAHLKEEQSLSDVLDKLISDVLGEELDPKLELEGRLLVDVLYGHLVKCTGITSVMIEVVPYLLVKLEPGGESFAVHVLKTKEPHLTQTNGLNHLMGDSILNNCTFKKGWFHGVQGVVQKGVVCWLQ